MDISPPRALARSLSGLWSTPVETAGEEQPPASSFWLELAQRAAATVQYSLCAAPFEAIYTAAAVGHGGRACPSGYASVWMSIARISRSENAFGLWKGNSARLLGLLLPLVADALLQRYYLAASLAAESALADDSDDQAARLARLRRRRRLVVALAYIAVLVLRHVLELLAVRMYYHGGAAVAPSLAGTLRHVVATRGVAGLFRGLPITLLQAATFLPQFGASFLPLQALKIRQMVAEGPSEGTIAMAARMLREHGVKGFYSGWKCYVHATIVQEACQWLLSSLVVIALPK